MNEDSRSLKAARYYLGRGFAVLSVPEGRKEPTLRGWESLRLTEADLPRYFQNGSNIGLLNGAPSGGLVDVDLDASEALTCADYFLPATDLVSGRASKPNSHRWYICDPLVGTHHFRDLDGAMLLELRSTGSQTLVMPSRHPNGDLYVWGTIGADPWRLEGGVLLGDVRRTAGATLLARHWPVEGSRHHAAMAVAGMLLRAGWDTETVGPLLLAVGAAAGDEEIKDRLETVVSTERRLMAEGKATGAPTLMDLIGERVVWRLSEYLELKRPEPVVIATIAPAPKAETIASKPAKPTDDELRDRWIADHPDTAYGLGEWRRYADGIWPRVAPGIVEAEMLAIVEVAKAEGIRPTRTLLQSVTYLGRVTVGIADELWDANTDILVCRNGVLEFDSGVLRSHAAEDYATSGVPYDYDPTATAPTWLWFLERCVPQAAEFLQEFAGYALTTDTSQEIATWLQGPPGSGKSTFITGLEAMLGRRAGMVGLADIEKSRFALASLPGKTLIVATEQPASFIESSHILNALISGEPIQIEQKYKDPYTIVPRAKLCWAMNELPRVSNANSGLFRRVKVVEFPYIRVEDRDPGVKEAIREEGAGILNWARAGLARLMERQRFVIPPGVEEATAHFAATNDVPAVFIGECCDVGPAYQVGSSELYKRYRYWCDDNGHKPSSSTRIAEDWRRLGFTSEHTRSGALWSGVRLRLVMP